MKVKSRLQRLLCRTPDLLKFILIRRPNPDKNKLAFLSLIRRDQIVFDVGANFGSYTSLFSDIVANRGKVYAFEPVEATVNQLRENLCGKANVVAVQKALGMKQCRSTIFTPGTDLGQSSLAPHSAGSWSNSVEVREEEIEITTLDSFVMEYAISKIDFIKVDVEGAETLFLEGAEKTIRRFQPMLFLELNACWLRDFGESPSTVVERLASWGYSNLYEPVLENGVFGFETARVQAESNCDVLFTTSPF